MAKYIHTLGDSTLDNFYWMLLGSDKNTAKNNCVEGKLKAKGHYVVSHAFDGFTTNSVLGQDYIGAVLPPGSAKQTYMREKAGNGSAVSPLKELQKKISERPNATHYVAISVSGNDFRVNLHSPWRLIRDISQIQSRYLQILEKIKGLQGREIKPLLIFQYRTDANQDPYLIYTVLGILGSVAVATHLACFACLTAPIWVCAGQISTFTGGMFALAGVIGLYGSKKVVPLSVTKNVLLGGKISVSMIGGMLESFYQPILNQAKKDRIPILDLPNTFNPFEKLYECGIEPNEKGGALIADGIHHIVTQHDFSGESNLYSKSKDKSEYVGMKNSKPSNWRVAYPSKP